jgi:dUTP pyrophosphatase
MGFLVYPQTEELRSLYSIRKNFTTDAGLDLYCPETIVVPPRSQAKIDFKINCEMVIESKDVGYILAPRSSIVKTPLMLCNSVGIIDFGYRNEIMAFVHNISDKDFELKRGTSLFQICLPNLSPITFEIVGHSEAVFLVMCDPSMDEL